MFKASLLSLGLIFLLVLTLGAQAHAQNEHLIGRKVMTIKWDTEARKGNDIVRKLELGKVFEVTKVNGQWLWFNNAVGGWVMRKDVVPYEQAIDHFNRLVQQNPSAQHYRWRAEAWKAKGELDIAIGDLNEAIRLTPTEKAGYVARGTTWYDKGNYDKAIADYNEAIRLDPKYPTAYNNRGYIWYDKGNYNKAIADYNEAIRLDPKYAVAYNSLAWLLSSAKDSSYRDGLEAVKNGTKGSELTNWKDWRYIDTLAAAHAEAGNFDEAVKRLKQAREMAPADQSDYFDRCLKLYESGQAYTEE